MLKRLFYYMLHLLKIPKDEDAKGIVVRTINHKYYLHLHTLRFIDPYIEVEYNLSQRRENLRILSNICIFLIIFACIIIILNNIFYDTEQLNLNNEMYKFTNISSIILGVIYLFILCIIRFSTMMVYLVDWCSVAIIIGMLWVSIYPFVIYKIITINLALFSDSFTEKHIIGMYVLYTALPFTLCYLNIVFFYILKNICTYPKMVFMCFIQTLFFITINIMFINNNWNHATDIDEYHNLGLNQSSTTYPDTQMIQIYNYNKLLLYSIYNISYYLKRGLILITTFWIMFTSSTIILSRNHEILSKENFILKRVKSDKDTRKFDDGGLVISSISDLDVINDNIDKVKLPSTESDPSNNKTPPIIDIANNYLIHQNTYTIWNSNNENDSNDIDISKNIEIEIGEKCDNFDSMTSLASNSIISNNEMDVIEHALKELLPISEEKYSRSESND